MDQYFRIPKFFGLRFFGPIFLDLNDFGPNFFHQIFFAQIFFSQTNFLDQILTNIYFRNKIVQEYILLIYFVLDQHLFGLTFFLTYIFWTKIIVGLFLTELFWDQHFLHQILFDQHFWTNFIGTRFIFGYNLFSMQKLFLNFNFFGQNFYSLTKIIFGPNFGRIGQSCSRSLLGSQLAPNRRMVTP